MNNTILEHIVNKVNGKLSKEYERELNDWINESELNKKSYSEIFKYLLISKDIDIVDSIDKSEAWYKIIANQPVKRVRPTQIRSVLKYAAVILLPILTAALLYFYVNSSPFNDEEVFALLEEIQAGTKKATLVLHNGTILNLSKHNKENILVDNRNLSIKDSANMIIYKSKKISVLSQNDRLYVPKGGE